MLSERTILRQLTTGATASPLTYHRMKYGGLNYEHLSKRLCRGYWGERVTTMACLSGTIGCLLTRLTVFAHWLFILAEGLEHFVSNDG